MADFPPDVLLIEPRSVLYTRFQQTRETELTALSRIPLPESVFTQGSVSPVLADPTPLVDAFRRIAANRKLESVSVLLPDSWFRLHLLTLETLPDRWSEADEMVRWSLKRALPSRTDRLRLAWRTMEKTGKGGRVAVLAASEESIARLEDALESAGMAAALIEPAGLSLWNALSGPVPDDGRDRLLFVARSNEMALALFRGERPVFYRSKRISAAHDLMQEVRLSISYLRNQVGIDSLAICWVAGEHIDADLRNLLGSELDTAVHVVTLEDVGIHPGSIDVRGEEIAVAAAVGVFAA